MSENKTSQVVTKLDVPYNVLRGIKVLGRLNYPLSGLLEPASFIASPNKLKEVESFKTYLLDTATHYEEGLILKYLAGDHESVQLESGDLVISSGDEIHKPDGTVVTYRGDDVDLSSK